MDEGARQEADGNWTHDADCHWFTSARHSFRHLWEELHGDGTWAANPEVVALSFAVARENIDSTSMAAAA